MLKGLIHKWERGLAERTDRVIRPFERFDECDRNGVNFDRSVVPWEHHAMGEAPFKYYDGYLIVNHLRKHL